MSNSLIGAVGASVSVEVEPEVLREEVRRWVDARWEPDVSLLEWRRRLLDAGWAFPTWPQEWGGRGVSAALGEAVADELAKAGVPGAVEGVGTNLAAPTILEHGPDTLRDRLLASTATGELTWCQLFSEPGAGSDLAGLTTRAERDGDEWVVTGQKVWNTGAADADVGLLLARSDWDVPKHRGITYFVLPMRQAGVEVRPLRQMNGHASFNEVFLDAVRVPGDHVIGRVGEGWQAALTTLAHERRLARTRGASFRRDGSGRVWREALAERRAASEPHRWYPQRAGRPDLLVERAVATGRSADPLVRQEVARVLSLARAARWTAERAAAARTRGRPPGPEGSLGKLVTSNIARAASRAHALIAGAAGMLAGSDAPVDGTISEIFVSVPAQSIAGGTDEIQRNILAERILGLPKEPEPDRDLPFRQVPKNA
jgi:alkylation response protein AidB-like acyl-CoA dehydrogenase